MVVWLLTRLSSITENNHTAAASRDINLLAPHGNCYWFMCRIYPPPRRLFIFGVLLGLLVSLVHPNYAWALDRPCETNRTWAGEDRDGHKTETYTRKARSIGLYSKSVHSYTATVKCTAIQQQGHVNKASNKTAVPKSAIFRSHYIFLGFHH